ncbi:hypothetical protein FA95DRAFT_1494741 [Auriscalpium vulgare]|uniref:Uncharacterized protein n=1 Tax=Auriscalpium vulgare TaxID=40419 RepID=A0ACB8RPA7_9AGAM|nr:hypothetical protein FA95DRAFT_1494741 [Auriscalpium vulgare]
MPQHDRSYSPSSTGDPAHPSASSAGRPSTSTGPSRAGRSTRSNSSSQVIACRLCRARKIRCDSTRPECNNCLRRHNQCVYDLVPKRRGPDKRPGTRQRSCKKRPTDESDPQPRKRRKTDPADEGGDSLATFKDDGSSLPSVSLHAPLQVKADPDLSVLQALPQSSSAIAEVISGYRVLDHGFIRQVSPSVAVVHPTIRGRRPSPTFPRHMASLSSTEKDAGGRFDLSLRSSEPYSNPISPPILSVPSIDYWWDNLLNTYSATRGQAYKDIAADLASLFSTSNYWLTFFHMETLSRQLRDDEARSRMQPVILAALALATLMKSSETGLGESGRKRALRLRDEAQAALEAYMRSDWADLNLAKAATILALFETSAHPKYSPARADSALLLMDKIISGLHLTSIDAGDPETFDHQSGVPTVVHHVSYAPFKECQCINTPPDGAHCEGSFSFTPAWHNEWSEEEVKNEETRRLCWGALFLVATHTVTCAATAKKPLNLYLINSSNYQLLFPGEYYQRLMTAAPYSGKDTVWALFCRSLLLWNVCVRFQDESIHMDRKVQLAIQTFVEIGAVERLLDTHICNIDTALIYMCREFISNTRLAVTYLTRRIFLLSDEADEEPLWDRALAEKWLDYQRVAAERVTPRLTVQPGHLFLRRPFQIGWFASQVSICLRIYRDDNGLVHALALAEDFMKSLDILNSLWPCPAYRRQGEALGEQLRDAQARAGRAPLSHAILANPNPPSLFRV